MPTEPNSGPIVVQVGIATVRMDPVGFALYAEEFYIAGAAIPAESRARGNTNFSPVPYYLFCRALELILKAYLLTTSQPLSELKTAFGHDLVKLWRAANAAGMGAILGQNMSSFEKDLQKANAYYKKKAFEYFDFSRWAGGYQSLPLLASFGATTFLIVSRLKKHCLDVS